MCRSESERKRLPAYEVEAQLKTKSLMVEVQGTGSWFMYRNLLGTL